MEKLSIFTPPPSLTIWREKSFSRWRGIFLFIHFVFYYCFCETNLFECVEPECCFRSVSDRTKMINGFYS